jgi:CubicO group peptidase (beta-lactamase class C family)
MKKNILLVLASIVVLLTIGYILLPYHARQALIHWYPDIDDLHLFDHHVVQRADSCGEWPLSVDYNTRSLAPDDDAYLTRLGTVAYLVIRGDSILHEEYRDGWNATLTSNIFSATKSIVGLLVGIAWGEGKIRSLDDAVGEYLPDFAVGAKSRITVRHLLTMSSGLDWDESYSSPFSRTTRGYYGRDLRALVTELEAIEPPGLRFDYRSGDTQALAFLLEAATGETVSAYAQRVLWQPMHACRDAYWLVDKPDGDEKAFCCFHAVARDIARVGRLLLRGGDWDGRQIVPADYMAEATRPATYLTSSASDSTSGHYGFQTWIMHYRGMTNPYLRGMLGQYVIAIPSLDAIVVRLGHVREEQQEDGAPVDLYRYVDIALRLLAP